MKMLGMMVASVLLLCACLASEQVVEIGNVQVAKSLNGTITDAADAPVPGVQVLEVNSDWKTMVRSTVTDANGHWSLGPMPHQKVYYIRLIKGGFNELRFHVRLDSRKGKELRIKLPLA